MASNGGMFVYGLATGMSVISLLTIAAIKLDGNDLPNPFSDDRGGYSESRTAPEEPEPEKPAPAPVTIKAGQEFKVGGYTVLNGWRIYGAAHPYGYGGTYRSATLTSKVRNNSPGSVGGVHFRLYLIRGDGSEAASIFCFGGQMAAGETLPLGCDSNRDDWPAKYDRIELEHD